jgi:hypothetical protein
MVKMNWYKIISEPERIELPEEEMLFSHTERLTSPHEVNEMGLIGQFFVAPRVLIDSQSPVQIPIFEPRDREIVLHEVAPHFTSCKIMHFQGETKTIGILTGVKPTSQDLFLRLRNEGRLHPLVADLFRDEKPRSGSTPMVHTLYEINKESLGFTEPEGFRELWDFIYNSFVKEEGHITVIPTGWEFGEPLTESLYLRALNTVCSHISLYVDSESNRVTAISAIVSY